MPVNTTSTGATYGKSSDPLCPLGFHPQVRWPTRCKRCFRDYKEHSDSHDQKKFANLDTATTESDPWSVRKSSFQKSKSVDVTIESGASAASRFASYTTKKDTVSDVKTEEDIPEWKKAMLERRRKDKEREEEEQKARNFGFIPGTTLHSSYVNKSYDNDARLTSWGSASNLRSSNSYTNLTSTQEEEKDRNSYRNSTPTSSSTTSWSRPTAEKKPEPELSPYEKYLQRKREQDRKEEDDARKKEEERREEEKKQEKERLRRREEEKRKEEEAEKERQRKREKEREEKRKKEEEEERKRKEVLAQKKKEEEAKQSTATASSKWGSQATKAKTPTPEAKPKPKWGAGSSTAAPVDEVPKKKPWEKPSAAAKSTLPSLNESSAASKSKVTFTEKSRKTSESDSDSASVSNISKVNHHPPHNTDSEPEGMKKELETLKNELRAVKSRNEVLEHMQSEAIKKTPLTLESAKASEATAELIKAREKIRELDTQLSTFNKDKKALNLKIKELESDIERRPHASETQKTISELQTKQKYLEKKCAELSHENEDLKGNVQNLEVELEEVQDNFREDEADEYRTLKRELENSAKNCRVLQFKLKKTEKSLVDLQSEHTELEGKMKSVSGGSAAIDNLSKVRQLEKDLEAKTQQISRLEAELRKSGPSPRKGGPGPCLSRTGSVERNVEDQLLKDLQDSIERENDLKEQLSLAEDESGEVRKKMSRLEDENEALSSQLKKMAVKKTGSRRSPSPYNRNSLAEKDEGISEDGEELSPAELKVQLEVSEQETELLRKKVENILTENLKLTKEVKDIQTKLTEAKKAPAAGRSYGYGATNTGSGAAAEKKLEELQSEVNTFRVKLIEKDRELERLDAQVKSSKNAGGKTLKRGSSQEEDLHSKLAVIEKEAEVLRSKTQKLEQENESLKSASKGKVGGLSQNDKFSLEGKIKDLETKLKDSNKKITELEDSNKGTMRTSLELDRVKRDKSSMEAEVVKLKDQASAEKRKCEKMERDMVGLSDKVEKAQREVIGVEREKRRIEEDKNKLESQVSRLETDMRSVTREKDRLKDEAEAARQKNRENLSQTQEGMKAFKDQIDNLKQELSDEKRSSRDLKRQVDDKARSADTEAANLRRDMDRQVGELEEKKKKVRDLEDKISDIEEKWAKSKRINQQRKDKIDKLEQELENASKNSEADLRIKELEKQLQSKGGSSWEITKINKELESVKKEKAELQKKHENLEEEFVVLKAKSTMEKDEMSSGYGNMQDDYHTIKGELVALRQTYNNKSDEWIKEKLELEKQVRDLETAIKSSAGSGWDAERIRFKSILEDRDSQITNLKIECDVARSQHGQAKKETEDLKQKLQDYEKMSKYGRSVAGTSSVSDSNGEVEELKKQLATEQKESKSAVNNVKMKYDSKIAIMTEEVHALKSQSAKYRRERETYKEMFEGVQKKLTDTKSGKLGPGDAAAELNDARSKLSDMTYQIHVLEDDLADSKMEAAKAHANMTAQKSNFEIQVAELNSKINELEEESLIDSGRARIAGTRTKMELAWQKERESQKKLINELNTMNRDLKSTLIELEKEKERDRLDSKRKIDGMKRSFEDEHEDTKKQITDLQYDLLELRDAHAKLRTTNEKLRRDKEKGDVDIRSVSVGLSCLVSHFKYLIATFSFSA